MDDSQGTADLAALGASMQSLNDDMLRMILMLLPQDDRCQDDVDTDPAKAVMTASGDNSGAGRSEPVCLCPAAG